MSWALTHSAESGRGPLWKLVGTKTECSQRQRTGGIGRGGGAGVEKEGTAERHCWTAGSGHCQGLCIGAHAQAGEEVQLQPLGDQLSSQDPGIH